MRIRRDAVAQDIAKRARSLLRSNNCTIADMRSDNNLRGGYYEGQGLWQSPSV